MTPAPNSPQPAQNAEQPHSPSDWHASVPQFDQTGDVVFFAMAEEQLKAVPSQFRRAGVEAIDLVIRQFQALQLNYGLQPLLDQQVELLRTEEEPSLTHHVRAIYLTAILVRGIEELSLKLALALREIPADVPSIQIALSPLHRYAIWFCTEGLRDHLLPRGRNNPDWLFDEPEIIEKACDRVVEELAGIEEQFIGPMSPSHFLMTLNRIEEMRKEAEGSGEAGNK